MQCYVRLAGIEVEGATSALDFLPPAPSMRASRQARRVQARFRRLVVVAIIGILATIAVPNFQKFQSQAKQSAAKTELTSLYTAQKAFFVEYNTYNANLPWTGFVPSGFEEKTGDCPGKVTGVIRNYTVGFSADGSDASAKMGWTGATGTAHGCTKTFHMYASTVAGMDGKLTGVSTETKVDTFIAGARGKVGGNQYADDKWQIDHNRTLKQVVTAATKK